MKLDVTRAAVEAEIARYVADPKESATAAATGARRHYVLPLWTDFVGCIAIRPDGEIVFFAWDDPAALEAVSDRHPDQQMIHAARGAASRRYPELTGLVPIRTASAKVCESCSGTGVLPNVPANLVCACGGLGWLP